MKLDEPALLLCKVTVGLEPPVVTGLPLPEAAASSVMLAVAAGLAVVALG